MGAKSAPAGPPAPRSSRSASLRCRAGIGSAGAAAPKAPTKPNEPWTTARWWVKTAPFSLFFFSFSPSGGWGVGVVYLNRLLECQPLPTLPRHADHVHDVLFLNLHSPRCGVTPRSKWPCQDKSHGSGSWESEAKGDASTPGRMVDAKEGEPAGSLGKEGGGAAWW